jgi:hypothetical protein
MTDPQPRFTGFDYSETASRPVPAAKAWIAVASADHVRIGRAGGFMQVCHGKAGPLRRLRAGDTMIYYSPTEAFGAGDGYRSFTAVGTVRDGEAYPVQMTQDFRPFRKDVDWWQAREAPIRPFVGRLAFTKLPSWGYQLRYGLFEIDAADAGTIAGAMSAEIPLTARAA